MNHLMQLDQIAQLTAAALMVVALGIMFLIFRTGIQGFSGATQANAGAFNEAIRTLKEAQEGQRLFYSAKIEDMRGEVQRLSDRVRELEQESDRKDKRISDLERENGELREEIERLRARINATAARASRRKKGQ